MTPCETTPWSAAATTIVFPRSLGLSVRKIPASCTDRSSSRPRLPGGLVNSFCRSSAARLARMSAGLMRCYHIIEFHRKNTSGGSPLEVLVFALLRTCARRLRDPLYRGEQSPSVQAGLLTRGWISFAVLLPNRTPTSGLRPPIPLTVALPRRTFTAFPILPWGAPERAVVVCSCWRDGMASIEGCQAEYATSHSPCRTAALRAAPGAASAAWLLWPTP